MTAALSEMLWYKTTSGLGGAITATRTLSQVLVLGTGIGGVTVLDGSDNAVGIGSIRYVAASYSFFYTPPSGSEGVGVVVSGTGEVLVRGLGQFGGSIRLSIVYGSLPGADTTTSVTVTNKMNDVFDDVTKAQAFAGLTEYRCVYFKNTSASGISDAAFWINADSVGGDTISIGLDPAGVGGTATTIGSETTAPAGVVFSQPLSESVALSAGAMAAGQSVALWIRRTVTAGTVTAWADDYTWMRFRVLA